MFVLSCEGRNTEPSYFGAIRSVHSRALIEIKVYGGVGVPYTVAEKAVEFAQASRLTKGNRRAGQSFAEHDQVWAIFDVDEHPRFNEAVALCERHGVRVARSNPCFELWLILHLEDYDRPNQRRALQARLGTLRPEFNPRGSKTLDCNSLMNLVQLAEARAAAQLQKRSDGGIPYDNPSTTVGLLTREIREANELASP